MVSEADIHNAKILVVDDQEANVTLLEQMLLGAGYTSVSSTQNPREVCDLYFGNRYDLILLDLQMPGMDGFEVMEALKELETGGYLPVLVITAQPEHKLRALKAGAKDFVSKPFDLAEILMRVHNMIEVRLLHLESIKLYEQILTEQKVSQQLLHIFRSGALAVSINTVADGRIVDANEEHLRFFGYLREEIAGRRAMDINLWANPEERAPVMQRLLKEGAIRNFEARQRTKSGEVRDVLASLELIELAGETDPLLIFMFTDITERKKAEQALRESEERYRDIFENASDLILSVAPDGHLLYANRAWRDTLGYSSEDLGNLNLHDVIPADLADQSELMMTNAAGGKTVQLVETEFVSKADKRIFVEGSVSAKIVNSRFESLRCIFRDTSERKKAEAQQFRNQRMESIGTLAGGIAHDLNNMLGPIVMAIELLRSKITDRDSLKILDVLAVSARHGADMVKQVLTFSRGVEGRLTLVPITQLIGEIETIIQHTFPKSIQLQIDVPRDVWTVKGDATQLHQAMLNLCVNARDAMPNGGTLALKVENLVLDEYFARMNPEAKAGPYVVFNVTDSGTGISQSVRDRIFEPFFTTKPLEKGTGLGLSTVRGIVKGHHGFIAVYSEVGKGSLFKVYLPAALSNVQSQITAEETVLIMGHGELVLVVDDEAAILSITQQTLETFGYRVLTATDGAQAIAICAQNPHKIQLMLTDMMMPIMDGPATIRAARKIEPAMKIIAASGLGPDAGEADPKQFGADAFLQKPYTAELLLKVISDILAPAEVDEGSQRR
jgi:PAS domain S-box-containing protein